MTVCVRACTGQARDMGEAVAVLQDVAVQPLLHPAATHLRHILLHRVLQHPLRLGLHAAMVSDIYVERVVVCSCLYRVYYHSDVYIVVARWSSG